MIRLTKLQSDLASGAIDSCYSRFCEQGHSEPAGLTEYGRPILPVAVLPRVKGDNLILSTRAAVNQVFAWELESVRDEPGYFGECPPDRRQRQAAARAAGKLLDAMLPYAKLFVDESACAVCPDCGTVRELDTPYDGIGLSRGLLDRALCCPNVDCGNDEHIPAFDLIAGVQ